MPFCLVSLAIAEVDTTLILPDQSRTETAMTTPSRALPSASRGLEKVAVAPHRQTGAAAASESEARDPFLAANARLMPAESEGRHIPPPDDHASFPWLTVIIIIILLAGCGGFGWWFYQSRRELKIKELHQAIVMGRVEFATTVLHNIGNVLNSLRISCDKSGRLLRTSKVEPLRKAVKMMEANMDNLTTYLADDPRGKLLPGYFISASQVLVDEQNELLQELEEMNEKILLMQDIIETQQIEARVPTSGEALELNKVVSDALRIQEASLTKRRVIVDKQLGDAGLVEVYKTQLVHIIINLVKNAMEAMENNMEVRRLTVETGTAAKNRAFLKVMDNGVGIDDDAKKNLFNYGFTTKCDGHGFGLNFCARAMKEMGGTIEAFSEGVNKGATFTLYFPKAESEEE